MKEYIEREAVRNALYDADTITMRGVEILNQYPAADVVERQTGQWEEVEVDYISDMDKPPEAIASMFCPECKRYANTIYFYGDPKNNMNFCPNCGADMRRKGKNNE